MYWLGLQLVSGPEKCKHQFKLDLIGQICCIILLWILGCCFFSHFWNDVIICILKFDQNDPKIHKSATWVLLTRVSGEASPHHAADFVVLKKRSWYLERIQHNYHPASERKSSTAGGSHRVHKMYTTASYIYICNRCTRKRKSITTMHIHFHTILISVSCVNTYRDISVQGLLYNDTLRKTSTG